MNDHANNDEWLPKEFTERTVTKSVKKNIHAHKPIFDEIFMVDGVPLFSQVELNLNELCNRRCVFCPRSGDYPNRNLPMDLDLVESIASQLEELKFKGIVNICGTGEPLLTKHLESIVKKFGIRKIKIEIVTNGDKLTSELIKKLYAAGLTKFVVSMYDGSHQIKHFTDLFEGCGINDNLYILRDRWYDEEDGYGLIYTNRAGYLGKDLPSPEKGACYYPSYALYIDWNGDILLCCHDMYNRTETFGNVNDLPLIDLWKNQRLTLFRKKLNVGDRSESPCSNCNANGTVYGSNHAKLW